MAVSRGVIHGAMQSMGASYLVTISIVASGESYETEKHSAAVSRGATIALFAMSVAVTSQLDSVEKAWRVLIGLGAGTGLVYMLRWYWWRINAWSEIGAMVASGVTYSWLSGALGQLLAVLHVVSSPDALTPAFVLNAGGNKDAVILLATVAVTTVAWIVATFATKPEPDHMLDAFYRRVRPGGPGWAVISERLGFGREVIAGGKGAWLNWIAGVVAVYATLFGIGKVIFGEYVNGLSSWSAGCFYLDRDHWNEAAADDGNVVDGTPGGLTTSRVETHAVTVVDFPSDLAPLSAQSALVGRARFGVRARPVRRRGHRRQ